MSFLNTLRAMVHAPTLVFAVAVVRVAAWVKRNGWLLATTKVLAAVLAAAGAIWVAL